MKIEGGCHKKYLRKLGYFIFGVFLKETTRACLLLYHFYFNLQNSVNNNVHENVDIETCIFPSTCWIWMNVDDVFIILRRICDISTNSM